MSIEHGLQEPTHWICPFDVAGWIILPARLGEAPRQVRPWQPPKKKSTAGFLALAPVILALLWLGKRLLSDGPTALPVFTLIAALFVAAALLIGGGYLNLFPSRARRRLEHQLELGRNGTMCLVRIRRVERAKRRGRAGYRDAFVTVEDEGEAFGMAQLADGPVEVSVYFGPRDRTLNEGDEVTFAVDPDDPHNHCAVTTMGDVQFEDVGRV